MSKRKKEKEKEKEREREREKTNSEIVAHEDGDEMWEHGRRDGVCAKEKRKDVPCFE